MKGHIYLITNNVNRKGYVGKTEGTIAHRFAQHKHDSKIESKSPLYRAFRKYGIENFSVEEIVCCDVHLLNDLEKHYIKFYGTLISSGHGYNQTGGGGGMAGWHPSKETIIKLSNAHKEQRAWNKGKTHTPEHRDNLSAALKGRKLTPETIAKMKLNRKGMLGKHHSAATKEKIRATKAENHARLAAGGVG